MTYVLIVYVGDNPVRNPYEPKIAKFLSETEGELVIKSGLNDYKISKKDLYWKVFRTRSEAYLDLKLLRREGFMDEIDSLMVHVNLLRSQAKTRLGDYIRNNERLGWEHG